MIKWSNGQMVVWVNDWKCIIRRWNTGFVVLSMSMIGLESLRIDRPGMEEKGFPMVFDMAHRARWLPSSTHLSSADSSSTRKLKSGSTGCIWSMTGGYGWQ
jgi:hypothetical protein